MDAFIEAGAFLVTANYWLALMVGVFFAIAIGIIPGVGSLLVMAILLPFLVIQLNDAAIAIVLLAAITGCSNTLDSVPAVLVGLPSGGVQVTFLEGHQLARRGLGAHTMGAIYAVSGIGGIVGAITLALVIPIIKPFVLQFSYPEIAVMAMFGVAMVAVLSRGAMLKGIAGALFGLLLSTVGTDTFTGTARFTFGRVEMWGGLPTVGVLLGIFAIPELVDLTMTRKGVAAEGADVSSREVLRGVKDGLKRWKVAIRQSLYGVFMGAIPGVGASVIDWMSYALGILLHKGDRSQFGRGSLDGVLFTESAQNAKEGGQAIPTLALGIPGGTGWIMIIVAMMAFGITPGPRMLDQYAHITILIVITLGLGNLITTIIGLFATGPVARLATIPYPIIGFTVMPMVLLAAFTDMLSWFAIPIVFVFTVIGLLMKRYQWPRPPLVLGFILGPIIDRNLQTALGFHGALGILTRPLTVVMLVLLVLFTWGILRAMSRSERSVPVAAGGSDTGPGPELAARWRFTWKEEHIVPILGIAGGIAFAVAALAYPPRSQAVPVVLSLGIIALCLAQLVIQGMKPRTATEIMDIGMRSQGVAGATSAAAIIAGLAVLFVVLAIVVGLQYAAVAVAVLGPLTLLAGRLRWIGAVVSGGIVALFAWVLMDRVMAIIWPQPAFWGWF